jgi:hypothetical protein
LQRIRVSRRTPGSEEIRIVVELRLKYDFKIIARHTGSDIKTNVEVRLEGHRPRAGIGGAHTAIETNGRNLIDRAARHDNVASI